MSHIKVRMMVQIHTCGACGEQFVPRFERTSDFIEAVSQKQWMQVIPATCPNCGRYNWQKEPRKYTRTARSRYMESER